MPRVGGVRLDLGAQPLDVDVERLGVADVVTAPDAVDELHPGEDPSGVAQQHLQQLELLERQRGRPPSDGDRVPLDVHPDRACLQGGREQLLRLGEPAQHGLDPGQQLARRVRLGDVVVGADLQPDDLVDLAVLGGQHDDRHGAALAQLPAHVDAGQAGQHEVEQDEVGAVLVELGQCVGPGLGDGDLVALATEQVRERVGVRLLVLDDEDATHGVRLIGRLGSCGT